MGRSPAPSPPRPDLTRQPTRAFGWVDAELLHAGWLARLGAEGVAVLMLLAVAADRRGASFYSRARMAERLDLAPAAIDAGLARLLKLDLVAFRPWRAGARDGVWQILPLPTASGSHLPAPTTTPGPRSLAAILGELGIKRPEAARRPDSRGS